MVERKMLERSENILEQRSRFPATVIKVIDDYTVVINRGANDGIKEGQKFLIYALDPSELIDPETEEDLGPLELVKGRGSVEHVQEKTAIIKSSQRSPSKIVKTGYYPSSVVYPVLPNYPGLPKTIEEPGMLKPFDWVQIKDKAKPV